MSASPKTLLAVLALAAALPAQAAARAAPTVHAMVVGSKATLVGARDVTAAATTLRVGAKRCAVAGGTPLAVLAALRRAGGPAFRLRDYGSCSRSTGDAGGLFVTAIGPDRNRGRAGWEYKVDHRSGSNGAGDASGPFGSGLLRLGARVLWFWCVRATSCQHTLEIAPASARVAPGRSLTVTVTGYDDAGHGMPAAGASVTLAGATAISDAAGHATLTAPVRPGAYAAAATAPGLVPSFPQAVTVA